MPMPKFLRNLTSRREYMRRTSHPMTDAEREAFDAVFKKMDETFDAVHNLFEKIGR